MAGEGRLICDECEQTRTDEYCPDCGVFLCAECMREHREVFSYALPAGSRMREDVRHTAEARLMRAAAQEGERHGG